MYNSGSCISVDISASQIEVSEQNIVRLLEMDEADNYTLETIRKCIAQSFQYYQPNAIYSVAKVESIDAKQGLLILENKEFLIGKIIASQLQQAEYVALFACTIGKELESHVDNLFKTSDLLEAYIYSLIGSEVAEYMAAVVHTRINTDAAAQGLNTSNRFSPGYCKWNVAEQHKLFSFFSKGSIAIELTESALMNPVKSVSGIVGIGKEVVNRPYQCKACAEELCLYRDKKVGCKTIS